ncbi:hypothetical protein QUF76_02140 [Desulfobacterales bacterium HSG16]|nr:hypothetical protein [Desulfobacterales bacterium HSG16]
MKRLSIYSAICLVLALAGPLHAEMFVFTWTDLGQATISGTTSTDADMMLAFSWIKNDREAWSLSTDLWEFNDIYTAENIHNILYTEWWVNFESTREGMPDSAKARMLWWMNGSGD